MKKLFKYCPNCKSGKITLKKNKKYFCRTCQWTYYQNAAAAVMAFLILKGKILFTIRAKDPAPDKLDLPGGFIDPGETAENALRREIKEELGLKLSKLDYAGSAVNEYEYKNITYQTCDLIFRSNIKSLPRAVKKSEIKGWVLKSPDEINPKDLAFKSVKKAVELFKKK